MSFGIRIYRRDVAVEQVVTRIKARIMRLWWLPCKQRIMDWLEETAYGND